jgi:3'-phosphoadenosine 5'-phosphosulfate sulfotransferase (PAPS reductase)/FAD synthetase
VLHIDTGIGIPETQQFVIKVCQQYDWPLRIVRAMNCGQDYEQLVTERGFPGPNHHTKMYNRLKERPIAKVMREHKGGRVAFISGIRKHESARRARITNGECQREGRRVWIAPFFNLTDEDMEAYREMHNLPKNPVKELLCMSGECLCGAYAKPNELKEIETFFPAVGKRLRELEKRVAAAGFPWGWDEQPPAWWGKRKAAEKAGQADAFEAEAEEAIQMLCTSCQYKHEQDEQEPVIRRIA